MKSDYTGHSDLPALMEREIKLQQALNEMRFNSEPLRKAAQADLNDLREKIHKLRVQGG